MSLPDTVATHRFSSKLDSIDETDPCRSMASELMQKEEENPNIMVYKKMEALLEMMQDPMSGIVVKTVKSFISKIPSVFTGSDLIAWILKNLDVDDTGEALHLANLLGTYGYVFPIDDHVLSVKNDGTYYRFQTPCFWPSKCSEPENTDYAVYLCKRTMQNKQRLELVDYEAENLARLQKMFSRKWEFIFIQAEAQAKVDKKRDKLERKVLDSQERAFWDVHRPAPGCVNTTEVDIKKTCRSVKKGKTGGKTLNCSFEITEAERLATIDCLEKEVDRLRKMVERRRVKISKVAESYLTYYEQYSELDPFIGPIEPSNPWTSDNIDYWEQENFMKDVPQRRVKRWGFSVRELLKDDCGKEHFRKFLEKEFSAENLKFWEACQRLRGISQRLVPETVQEIYTEYLSPSAHDPVNVDCKVAETVRKKVEQNPDRYCFEEAEEHIYQLMKNDCYNRYLRSDMYKEFMSGTKKKSKKGFATEVRRFRDLTKTQGFVNLMHQQQQQQGSSPKTTMQQVVQAIREASSLGKLQQMSNNAVATTSSVVSTSTVAVAITSGAGTNSGTNSTTVTITTRTSVLTASNAKVSITNSPSFQPNPTVASISSVKEAKSGSFADLCSLSSHLRSALSSPKNSRNVKDVECSSVDGAIGTSCSRKGLSDDGGESCTRVIKKSLSVLQVVRGSKMTVDVGKSKSEVQKQDKKLLADNTSPEHKAK